MNGNSVESAVVGQKYAFATASLIMGIACYVNLLGMEKGLLAILFAWLALKPNPRPPLVEHRGWAKAGLAMGGLLVALVPTVLLLNLDRLRAIVDAIQKLQTGR